MSLRHVSRLMYQVSIRAMQGIKDQASKCDSNTVRSLKDSAACSKQARRYSSVIDSSSLSAVKNGEEKLKEAEESLRTVMYLSCWGPN